MATSRGKNVQSLSEAALAQNDVPIAAPQRGDIAFEEFNVKVIVERVRSTIKETKFDQRSRTAATGEYSPRQLDSMDFQDSHEHSFDNLLKIKTKHATLEDAVAAAQHHVAGLL